MKFPDVVYDIMPSTFVGSTSNAGTVRRSSMLTKTVKKKKKNELLEKSYYSRFRRVFVL